MTEPGTSYTTVLLTLCLLLGAASSDAQDPDTDVTTVHGLTLYGDLKYDPDFRHFEYANPDAPKGGSFRFGFSSAFDNLNPFIVAGTAPANMDALIFDPLMRRSGDEPSSVYGVIAESVSYPADYAWAEFTLREEARWHDGKPVTAEDVVFSLDIMKTQSSPQFRATFSDVETAEAIGPRRVRFTFTGDGDRGTLYNVSQLMILPEHYWRERDFAKPSIDPPLGSGPYRVGRVDPGRSVVYERVADYWAADLPINRGLYNFAEIRHDYYRDIAIQYEALLAGSIDFRWETLPTQWATGYDLESVREGRLIQELLPYSSTTMFAGYFFNLRMSKLADRRLRQAIAAAFDFEWTNRMIFHGQYVRLQSYFENSELAAHGLPSQRELELLEPFRDQLPPELFTKPFESPATDGTRASLRENLREALRDLYDAGYTLDDGQLRTPAGDPIEIEILSWDPFFERVTGPFMANLELLGIKARQRTIDTAQWFNRIQNFDFDVTIAFYFPQSMSPGSELRQFFGSGMADQPGTQNYTGLKDPVVDALIEKVISAPDRESKVAATRALDRVLLWNLGVVPHYFAPGIPVVYWDKFGRPEKDPTWLRVIWHMSNWWVDPQRVAELQAAGDAAGGSARK